MNTSHFSRRLLALVIVQFAVQLLVASPNAHAVPMVYRYWPNNTRCEGGAERAQLFAASSLKIEFSRCFAVKDPLNPDVVTNYYQVMCSPNNHSVAVGTEYSNSSCTGKPVRENVTFVLHTCNVSAVRPTDSFRWTCSAGTLKTASVVFNIVTVVTLVMFAV